MPFVDSSLEFRKVESSSESTSVTIKPTNMERQLNNSSRDPIFNHQQLITIDSRPNIALMNKMKIVIQLKPLNQDQAE